MTDISQVINAHLDTEYLISTLRRLATVPTDVPLGFETLMEPDDPKLVNYVQHHVRPELVSNGVHDILEAPRNNIVAQVGSGRSNTTLLIQNYTVAQHHNLMEDAWSGKVGNARAYGLDEPAVFGQGVSQGKAHQAVMLAVLRMLQDAEIDLDGRLLWAVNNEGRSSHDCSRSILATLDTVPDFVIIQAPTGMRLSLGNRGRIDVEIHVRGAETHSSTPELGASAIEGTHQVMSRLETLAWEDVHPILGERHAIVYKVRFEPIAPHTLPSDAYITVDRRLLPGDDPTAAADEIRDVVGDLPPFEVDVRPGVTMLPALVHRDQPWVRSLQAANAAIRGSEADEVYPRGTFDAGGPSEHGIPTVMFGASGGIWPTGVDFVGIQAVIAEARVLAQLVLSELAS